MDLGASSILVDVDLNGHVTRLDGEQHVSYSRLEYHLTGPTGTNSSAVALNGHTLQLGNNGKLPKLDGEQLVVSGRPVALAPESIAFVKLRGKSPCMAASSARPDPNPPY
jgi:hypothetical protein